MVLRRHSLRQVEMGTQVWQEILYSFNTFNHIVK